MKVAMVSAKSVPSMAIIDRLPHQISARLSSVPCGRAETSRTRCSLIHRLHQLDAHVFLLRPEPEDAGDAGEDGTDSEPPRVEDGSSESEAGGHREDERPDRIGRHVLAMIG